MARWVMKQGREGADRGQRRLNMMTSGSISELKTRTMTR